MTLLTPLRYRPLGTLNTFNDLFKDINQLWPNVADAETQLIPTANVIEREKDYLIELEVPAVAKKDIEVAFKDNTLIVKGKRTQTTKPQAEYFTRIESRYGQFERSWAFEDVDSQQIKASAADGVLSLVLPKKVEVIAKNERKVIAVK